MTYKLRPIKHPDAPYVIEFSSPARGDSLEGCLLQEPGSGRIFIGPATMQVIHMEVIAPHHIMEFGKAPDGTLIPPVAGEWRVTVNYAPVHLGGELFWLPTTIDSVITAASSVAIGRASNSSTWSFNARYRNYHKLEVTSRILPADAPSTP
jgi:hypothetical protein